MFWVKQFYFKIVNIVLSISLNICFGLIEKWNSSFEYTGMPLERGRI